MTFKIVIGLLIAYMVGNFIEYLFPYVKCGVL